MVIGCNGSVCVSLWIPLLHRYAESVGAKHYHTSAKLNKGIEELFLDLCKSKQLLCYGIVMMNVMGQK